MQYNLYTVSVTNGSNIVNGALGTKFLSKVKAGNSFKVKGDGVIYQVSSVTSDTQLTLSTPYQGTTAVNVPYQITTDYTPNFGFAEINIGDQDWPTHLTVETLRKIDSVLSYSAGDGLKFQGDWNASTNTPVIPAASSANLGHFYKVTASGSTSVSGITHWVIGDTVISNGTSWFRISLPEYTAEEYAVAAAASASSASTSAATATTKASEASASASSASTSASSASTSAATATTKASEASASASSASTSATTATTKASEASTSATTATTKASEASASASSASTSATSANTAKLAAEAARDQALTALDNFDDRYLGQKASAPTVDNDGNPLISGALYFNTAAIESGGGMKVYDGTTWVSAYAAVDNTLVALAGVTTAADKLIYATGVDTFSTTTLTSTARDLLDDTSASAMRTTLGLGTAATTAATDYAAAAKGVTNGDSHDHVGGDGAQIAYSSLSGLPSIPSIVGLLDETAHDLLDHAGLTGIPSVTGLLDETAHDLLDHTGLIGIPTQYTNEMAQDAVGALITSGTQTGITVSYDDANNKIDFAVTASGAGDVTGPASATDGNIVLFDGATGKVIKNSTVSQASFAAALGPDDNYVTDAEKVKLSNLSGVNTGDQDLSGYSLTTHNHALNNLTEKSYNSLTDKPSIPSVAGLLNEATHDALDHTGLTGIPTAYILPTASTTVLGGVKVDGTSITIASGIISSAGGVDLTADQTWSGSQRGAVTTDTDLSFDMNAGQNFSCTPTGSGTLTFTNITAGQSGFIYLSNTTNYTISKHSAVKCGASLLSTISVTGNYLLNYFSPGGTNVYVTASGALS